MLEKADNMPAKWQMLIFLGQQTILNNPAYQNFVTENLRKYYPNPCSFSRSTWDINERFFSLDLSFTDEFLRNKYSVFGPKPRTPSGMQRSYLLSIDFKVDSITDWVAQLKI